MTPSRVCHWRWSLVGVMLTAAGIAFFSARNYAGSWNDGSRLATVECLVDRGTWAIDRSVYVQPSLPTDDRPAYGPAACPHGTLDKLFIDGQYYSDKSPVPALCLAGAYFIWNAVTTETAAESPQPFARVMTLASSGLAYVVAVGCVFALGRAVGLPLGWTLTLTASFALSTVALTYTRHVNNHILLLATAAALMLGLVNLTAAVRAGVSLGWRMLLLGLLAGIAYTIDLGVGPVLFAGAGLNAALRVRRVGLLLLFVGAAAPWLALHHGLNFLIGGTFRPANANPEYFNWPGCPFNSATMTGGWNHPSVLHFAAYSADMLFGKKGFLLHNLPLLLAVSAAVVLLRRRTNAVEVGLAAFWAVGTWLVYAATSTNLSGVCCSVRWFVPLLAPGYFVLAVILRDLPQYRRCFLVLSGWGLVMGLMMWWRGPWAERMVPGYWGIVAATGLTWTWLHPWHLVGAC